MHVAWLKPGRHTYTINYEPEEIFSDSAEGKQDALLSLLMNKNVKGKKSKKTFYVHEMLATYREEKVPLCKSTNSNILTI